MALRPKGRSVTPTPFMRNVCLTAAGALFAGALGCVVTACALPIGSRNVVPLLLAAPLVAAAGVAPLAGAEILRGEG